MDGVPMTGVAEFLNSDPINLEQNDDGSFYIPIWQVEKDLSILDEYWSRKNHKYSFHTSEFSQLLLASSHELVVKFAGMDRVLLCSSLINSLDYSGNSNLLQTGISEATKAGVKVLGRRFGSELNERVLPKAKKVKDPIKARPDKTVMKAFMKAVAEKDEQKIAQILTRYDIKTESDYA